MDTFPERGPEPEFFDVSQVENIFKELREFDPKPSDFARDLVFTSQLLSFRSVNVVVYNFETRGEIKK